MPNTPEGSVQSPRSNPSEELRRVAAEQFANAGFAGTSLQQIADAAGYSKSSVLYHFASKDALFEAVLAPAVDQLEVILADAGDLSSDRAKHDGFIERFINFLFSYRLEVHTFINQGQSLKGIPVIDRANRAVIAFAESTATDFESVEEKVRFGVALGGAAYALVASMNFSETPLPLSDVRGALITIVSTLLRPASAENE